MRARVLRPTAAIVVVGIALTSAAFVVVRHDVERLSRQRIDRPASDALRSVQHLTGAVDQLLATANGVYATSGGDAKRFSAVLGRDVLASPTIEGLALIVAGDTRIQSVARVGNTTLLAGKERDAFAANGTSNLVATRRDDGFRLGFAAPVAPEAAAYLEVRVPLDASAASLPFALVPFDTASPRAGDIVLGNVDSLSGLHRWNETVAIGGQSFALMVRPDAAPAVWLGIPLPLLVLLVGLVLTALAAVVAVLIARRTRAVEHLSVENRALDEALARQRAVEAELRASRARIRAILRDSPDVVMLLDLEAGTCEILNREDFLGHPLSTVAAPGGLRSLVHPDDDADAERYWHRLSELRDLGEDATCETTLRIHDGEGDARYARLRFSLLNLDDDSAVTLLGALSDVTDEWANQLREAELREALRRSQRLEAVGQLAGGVAHDFNNVLAAVQASVELLMDDVPAGRPHEYAQEIDKAARRGAALVRQLLTFAQQDRAEPRLVDVNDVVTGMEPLLRRSLGEMVQLQIATTGCACVVEADPTHLEQVILNLAVNARDAMPGGGVLWLATNVEFDETGGTDDRVVLSVTDTGTGIAPEIRDQMFQPFATTKEPGKGTGLGLATVLSIVQEVGADLNVLTEAGLGTTFEISFPRKPGFATDDPADTPAAHFDGARRRILLVEDDPAVRASLRRILERRNFVVADAPDAADALRRVERQPFDLVLTDAMMPGMPGTVLIDQLRATHTHLRVVLMTGYSRELVDADGAFVDVPQLRKPFTSAELMRTLHDAFTRTPAGAEGRTP
jgi:signal transduction histidine kinase